MTQRWVYNFGEGKADGGRKMRALLGGKGANLAEMARIGIPVPPGFTISTEACRHYLASNRAPDGLDEEIHQAIVRLEKVTGKRFGSDEWPLLVSVRSGAIFSMPGMMDTVLNLGLNERTVEALAAESEDERFAFDSYRRFLQMYGNVVLGVRGERFEKSLDAAKRLRGVRNDDQLTADELRRVAKEFRQLADSSAHGPFPDDPEQQLRGAIAAVFRSWNTPRARAYRRVNGIQDDLGTAVNVQAMVFGNLGETSGTGVAFTRNPATGEKEFFGEFLVNAQGEDVVAGTRDPLPIREMAERLPAAYTLLLEAQDRLEQHFRDSQDLEFTVERGRLYLLQTRTAKRTATAAIRIAVEMVDEELITADEALLRVDPIQLEQLLHPTIDPHTDVKVIATGLPASPGAASGKVVFNPDEAARRGEDEPLILVRRETSPEDYHGMVASRAILTSRGGMTSHAAVVARGMGKCCVAGAVDLAIDEGYGRFSAGDVVVRKGDWITLDGSTGRVILGRVPTTEPRMSEEFLRLMRSADEKRRLRVRANADTPHDATVARRFGAEGIGLCRTEHMFFEGDRIDAVREMILAETTTSRSHALDRLLPMQRSDFAEIFRAMDGLPVTIRLLDPPLHEFLPQGAAEIKSLSRKMKLPTARLRSLVDQHREANPMLGHRGVRLALTFPEITRMQARAIFEAAVEVRADGVEVHPEIMIPLVGMAEELRRQRELVEAEARAVFEESGTEIPFTVGTMIELPRAALTAASIAEHADFFSFGTNDLTQTTLGLSRDDAGSFLPAYLEARILPADPFQTIDQEGVGRLVALAAAEGRNARSGLKLGICGEHGGDPASVEFFDRLGLDYVSCSPYRIPVARLAAAQAVLRGDTETERDV
jgi:pyruvate, orthophosphate dikinase